MLSCIQKITDFRGRTPKKLGMDWSESGYLALSALNVKDGYIDFSQDVHYGNQALYDKWMNGNELHKGQVLFTTEAPMGNVAQVPDNKRYILSQRTVAFDVKEDVITENFLATLLRSPVVLNTFTSLSSGGTAKGISQKSLAGVDIKVPMDLREQTLLADYFRNIDNLITLHQRKCDKLQVLKKAMLEKMFPKNGSSVPEIRFKGFTDAWEQRKLGECFTERCESMPDGELISVTINDGIKKFSELGRHDTSNDDKSKYKKVCVGDIAYNSMRMWQGASGCSPYEGIVSPAYTVLTPNSGINSKCMAYQFKLPATIHTFKINSQGITSDNWNLKFPALSEIEIYISPYEQEQAKIAAYFANLDHLITLHQRELEKLQNIKKSMLEKMFV